MSAAADAVGVLPQRKRAKEALRESELRYRTFFQQSRDAIFLASPERKFLDVNQSMLDLFGYTRDEMVGMDTLKIYLDPSDRERLSQELHLKGSVIDYPLKCRKKDGKEMDCLLTTTENRANDGSLLGYQGILRDITERKRAEAELIHSTKMASLGVMLGGIAHELRNPLSIVSANAQLLLEHTDDVELHTACARKIHAATQRASLIIENLLKFSHPKSKLMEDVDMQAIVAETIALLTQHLTLHKVTVEKLFQRDLLRVHGNPDMLQQVLINLILNACNAMPQGGMLTIASRATDGGQVELQVGDTGVGIPQECLPKIFDPFFTTMPVGQGTGLGLSLAYSIVRRHQGTIEVASQVGHGTTVTVRLPSLSCPERPSGQGAS